MKWGGKPVAVLASGPSMTQEDADAIRDAKIKTIAVNGTWKLAPWCDVLYAGDYRWWKAYGDKIDIPAKRLSRSSNSEKSHGATYVKTKMSRAYNSGQLAIEVAIRYGGNPIILLGFDGSVANGVHWHGEHKKTPNPNKERCRRWQAQFKEITKVYPKAHIINCSRYTEIECFERADLTDVLHGLAEPEIHRARKGESVQVWPEAAGLSC